MFFKVKIICILWFVKILTCSKVIDEEQQSYINVAEYCPKKDPCPEGTHTLCMYYDPKRKWGPACVDPVGVKINKDLANHILDIINNVRHKVAIGVETGKGGIPLPRAYGMFRLEWDNELATFAQIMADRCYLKKDLCRATKKFSNPSQIASIVRHMLGWIEFPGGGLSMLLNAEPGLTNAKLKTAVEKSIHAWYDKKSGVTPDMIEKYPEYEESLATPMAGFRYLNLVYAKNTHIGCGISAYTQYAYSPVNQHVQYQIIQLVCNLSGTPTRNLMVFNKTKPDSDKFSTLCGCPEGSKEDDDCLCRIIPEVKCPDIPKCRTRKTTSTSTVKPKNPIARNACTDQSKCFDSSILPIVNLPNDPEILYDRRRSHFVYNRNFEEPRIHPRKLSQRREYNEINQAPNNIQFTGDEDKNRYTYANKYSSIEPNIHHFTHTRKTNAVLSRNNFTDGENLEKKYITLRRKHYENHNLDKKSSPNKYNSNDVKDKFVSNNTKEKLSNGEVNKKLVNILNSLEEDIKYFETHRPTFGEKMKNIYSHRIASNNVNHFERHLLDNIQYAKDLLHEMTVNGVYRKSNLDQEPVEALRYVEQINPEKGPEKRQQTALQYEYHDISNLRPGEKFENGNEYIRFVRKRKGSRRFGNTEDDKSYPADRRAYYQSLLETRKKHDDNMRTISLRATRPNERSKNLHVYREGDRARALYGLQ